MSGPRQDGWGACPPGELERLVARLRARRQAAGWVEAAAAVLASAALALSLYVTGSIIYVHFRDAPLPVRTPGPGSIKSAYIYPTKAAPDQSRPRQPAK